jgi:hypothetical protein
VISGIVRLSGSLFDDDALGVAPTASYLGIDIILPIRASWKTPLSIVKFAPPDGVWERDPSSGFELFEQIVSFLWRCRESGGPFDLAG